MNRKLLLYIICPECNGNFDIDIFDQNGEDIVDGILKCNGCNSVYPIVNSIPRILEDAFIVNIGFYNRYRDILSQYIDKINDIGIFNSNDKSYLLKKKTQKSFGFQWKSFSELSCDFKENFLNYIYPVREDFFRGKLVLDAGCGFGRHIYNATILGAEMIGIDYSEAIDSAYKNTKHLPNIHLVQCDIYKLPFKNDLFDFIYCIGVLHHLPYPEKAYNNLLKILRPNGSIAIWVYSKKRMILNFLLEILRRITIRLPHRVLQLICLIAALIDWIFFIYPYKIIVNKTSFLDKYSGFLKRIRLYSKYPFQVVYADWFDRLSPPIRFYYDEKDMQEWAKRARLKNIVISPTGLYGWRLYGEI